MRYIIAAFIALCVAGAVVVLTAGQLLIAPANGDLGQPPGDLPLAPVRLQYETGLAVHGWKIDGRPDRGAVLLLHGVRSSHRSMIDRARFLHRNGYAVMLIDMYAHGASPGDRIAFGYRESDSVVVALRHARKVWPNKRVAVIGSSLGGAAAVIAADRQEADAYVLEAVYPNLRRALENRLRMRIGDLGPYFVPLLLWQVPVFLGFGVDQLSIENRIGALDAPILMIAGELDGRTTLDDTRRLFARVRNVTTLWIVPGAAHQDLHKFARSDYEGRVLRFLNVMVDGVHADQR